MAADERFDQVDVRWEFVLVSNRLNDFAEAKSNLAHLPPGVSYQRPDGNVRVVVRTWGEIVDDCKERLKFVADKLDYIATSDDGLDYLRRLHAAAIPPVLRTITEIESEDEPAVS